MGELKALYVIWYRELLKWTRKRIELMASLMQPIFWLLIFGSGLGVSMADIPGNDFLKYLAPGVICQTILFSAFFNGVSILMDKEFGFLKEILVSPVKRRTILLGKLFGGSTIAFIQGSITFILAIILGVNFTSLSNILLGFLMMFVISLTFMSMGLVIATKIKEIESFQKLSRFTTMPMWFLSGGFYPMANIPIWLKFLVHINPLTYGVDLMRTLLINVSQIPIWIDLIVLFGFIGIMLVLGTKMFNKSENLQ
ncbi:MAG: ABC transporter permease [Promethearchaeota archaeon]